MSSSIAFSHLGDVIYIYVICMFVYINIYIYIYIYIYTYILYIYTYKHIQLYILERKRCSCKCDNSRCQICKNIEEIGTFTSAVAGQSFELNHHLCCDTAISKVKRLTRKVKRFLCKVHKKQDTRKTVHRLEFLRDEKIKRWSLFERRSLWF